MSGQHPAGGESQTERASTEHPARQDGLPERSGTADEDGARAGWRSAEPRAWRPPPTPVFLMIVVAVGVTAFLVLVALQRWVVERTYVISPLATEAPTASVATPSPQVSLTPTAVPEATAAAAITAVLPSGDPLEQEVSAAFREYTQVYADALYTLDAKDVPSVAAGEELQRILARIDSLRAQGQAIQVDVEHVIRVVRVAGVDADVGVRDTFKDRSYAIDPASKKPILSTTTPSDSEVQIARGVDEDVLYLFKRLDGTWKVVRSFRVAPE